MNYKEAMKMQLRNTKNQEQGQHFEEIIEAACTYYSDQRIAEIQKTPEPFKVIRRLNGGQFVGFFRKQAQPDFKGTLRGGKTLIFEAKHTTTEKMCESVLSAEQRTLFDRYSSLGATCFVLVSFNYNEFFNVPWGVFGHMKEHFGRKYFTAAEMAPYKIGFDKAGILNFLKK